MSPLLQISMNGKERVNYYFLHTVFVTLHPKFAKRSVAKKGEQNIRLSLKDFTVQQERQTYK